MAYDHDIENHWENQGADAVEIHGQRFVFDADDEDATPICFVGPDSPDAVARAEKIVAALNAPRPLMDKEKFKRLSAKLFTAAVHHSDKYGEVSFVDGDPDHMFQMCGPYAAFEAAADYFAECDFKYAE